MNAMDVAIETIAQTAAIAEYESVAGALKILRQYSTENKKLRELLWLMHDCDHKALYGDDGEMQCNNITSHFPIDFKRDTAETIDMKFRRIL